MSFVVQASPGVKVRELDLTSVIQQAPATDGAFVGRFRWGPVEEPVLLSDETGMVQVFGQPRSIAESTDFHTAQSFLQYTNALRLVRVVGAAQAKASSATFEAKYPGELGNSVQVSVQDSDSYEYSASGAGISFDWTKGSKVITVSEDGSPSIFDISTTPVGQIVEIEGRLYSIIQVNDNTGAFPKTITLDRAITTADDSQATLSMKWEYSPFFGNAPDQDCVHIVEIDALGEITGTVGSVLNQYDNLSINDSTAIYDDGTSRFYSTSIERKSSFITINGVATPQAGKETLAGGSSDNQAVGASEYVDGHDVLSNQELVDASLIFVGDAPQFDTIVNFAIDNIAESRRDCVVFVGPQKDDVVNNKGGEVNAVKARRNSFNSSSYVVMSDNWKYMYDKYNDRYIWVPTTGDVAGLVARTEVDRAQWFSPAGYNRGILKNAIKLAWSADETQRNQLFPVGINSIVDFAGIGKTLYGDKTLAANQNSAFSRINVRRLFLVLEKAIANAAKFNLFEFNDEFTRASFVSIVEPFLREVQGGRGITDFEVVCDERNNTPQVIDTNNFVCDIYIKPARSINFITLNFVAVGTGVSFEEVIGRAA